MMHRYQALQYLQAALDGNKHWYTYLEDQDHTQVTYNSNQPQPGVV